MEETERTQELKQAFAKGIINIEELEEKVGEELRGTARRNDYLNTSDSLDPQIWFSESRIEHPDPAKLEAVDGEMHLPIKPTGGMWTSTYTPEEEFDCDWLRWCASEGFYNGRHKWLLEPKSEFDVLVVDSLEDLKAVTNAYTKDSFRGTPASDIGSIVLDFEAMAENFDAMRLTQQGQWETRMTSIDEPDLYGWDSESVLHFRWNWSEFEYMGKSDIDVKTYTE